MLRLFAAIYPPQPIRDQLASLQTGIADARWVAPEKFHITLCFFGGVDYERAELLDSELARIPFAPFELNLSGVGHFGRSHPHSLWAGLAPSDPLHRLHQHCKRTARRLGITIERRLYTPHITLAYLTSSLNISPIVMFKQRFSSLQSPPFTVHEFRLISSHTQPKGPNLYMHEADYPLRGLLPKPKKLEPSIKGP